MSDPRDIIAEAVAAVPYALPTTEVPLIADVLTALHAAGYRIAGPLPEQTDGDLWDGDVTAAPGMGKARLYLDDHRMTPVEARALALALWAAAEKAEEATDE